MPCKPTTHGWLPVNFPLPHLQLAGTLQGSHHGPGRLADDARAQNRPDLSDIELVPTRTMKTTSFQAAKLRSSFKRELLPPLPPPAVGRGPSIRASTRTRHPHSRRTAEHAVLRHSRASRRRYRGRQPRLSPFPSSNPQLPLALACAGFGGRYWFQPHTRSSSRCGHELGGIVGDASDGFKEHLRG